MISCNARISRHGINRWSHVASNQLPAVDIDHQEAPQQHWDNTIDRAKLEGNWIG
jgi:hypothetical protein